MEVIIDTKTPLGILSPLLSFQKAVGPLNGEIAPHNSRNNSPLSVNRIHKNSNSDKSSKTKMPIEEFQTYFDFSKSCLDPEQHRILLEFLYEYEDLFVKKGESQISWKWIFSSLLTQPHLRRSRIGLPRRCEKKLTGK
jgi:hypothetical protein